MNQSKIREKEKTNSGYRHNKYILHGIFNLTFHMHLISYTFNFIQHTPSEVTVTKHVVAYETSSWISHAKLTTLVTAVCFLFYLPVNWFGQKTRIKTCIKYMLADVKCWKTCEIDPQYLLVLLMIGWKCGVVMQYQLLGYLFIYSFICLLIYLFIYLFNLIHHEK